jgi:AcrR family transcriptional regulator
MKRKSRAYRKRSRADAEDATRRRIVQAAVALHRTIGPARTTISSVAARARVSRPTVYRHFPDLPSLFAACMSHDQAADPMPDPSAWSSLGDPMSRLRQGLTDLYAYYRRNPGLSVHMRHDGEVRRILEEEEPGYLSSAGPNPEPRAFRLMGAMEPMVKAREKLIVETLAAPYEEAGRSSAELEAAITVAVDVQTWVVLTRHGFTDSAAAEVAARMVDATQASPPA